MMESKLWKHQEEVIERAKVQDSFGLFFDVGTGKSRTLIEILRDKFRKETRLLRTLIVSPPITLENWKREWLKYSKVADKDLTILYGSSTNRLQMLQKKGWSPNGFLNGQIFITNYETLNMPKVYTQIINWQPEAIILDECFGPETLVEMADGSEIKIKDLRVGDIVKNATGYGKIKSISTKKITDSHCELSYNNRKIKVSLKHLYLTQEGWKEAQKLQIGDYLVTRKTCMSLVQKSICSRYLSEQQTFIHTLLCKLCNAYSCAWNRISRIHKKSKSYEEKRCPNQSFKDIKENEALPPHSRRKWTWPYGSRAKSNTSTWERLCVQFCSDHKNAKGLWVSPMLQSGSLFSRFKTWYRNRWVFAPYNGKKRTRPEKDTVLEYIRLEDIKIFQQGSYDGNEESCYYDIGVEGHPSFIVNGAVVHNCHRIKNPSSKRTKQALKLGENAQYKFILTGSPVLGSILDLYTQISFLDGGKSFGKNFFVFRAHHMYDANAGMPKARYFPNWKPLPGADEKIQRAIAPFVAYAKKGDCLDLPPLIRNVVPVEMSEEQRKLYNDMKRDFIAEIKGKTIVATMALTKLLRLQQLASGFCRDVEGTDHVLGETPKIDALHELLEKICVGQGDKCIVWSVWLSNYASIRKVCEDLKIEYREIHGGILGKKKFENVDAFCKDTNVKVLIAHPESAGEGINLIEAAYSIYFSRTFSLKQEIQSEARNYRGGSGIHKQIIRYDLVTKDSVDELIAEKLANKQAIGTNILEGIEKYI